MREQSKPNNLLPLKSNLSVISHTKKSIVFVYLFMLFFIISTFIILFNSSSSSSFSSSSFLRNIVNLKNPSFLSSNNSHFPFFFTHFLPNSSSSSSSSSSRNSSFQFGYNVSSYNDTKYSKNFNLGNSSYDVGVNGTMTDLPSHSVDGNKIEGKRENGLYESMFNCDLFVGKWVKDDSYPLYEPGSCPYIDEPFDCYHNGRPDNDYEKYRWQPHGCNIPRFNGTHMLELLMGKRMVFVGDSLNRNMWESLVCLLRNSVKNRTRVFEASGREEFRTEGSYAFIFEDYNCSVEFFRSPFLVREWEMPDTNGSTKETLRLDLVEESSYRYKDADFLIFNTGHWWSHEKTTRGESYYQEGTHVYTQLEVNEAIRRALTTWGRWLDANVNPMKTQVFFRGYSNSHFGGGKWNSGGRCDMETEPIKSDADLPEQPSMIKVVENVIRWTELPVYYLNITGLTDYRKDAHPAVYREQQERRSPSRYQDCSHWCLPGVPDTWNELVYSQILIRLHQKQKLQHQQEN